MRHFEVEWGAFLPASADGIARYLAQRADQQSIATLRQRLATLSRWHQDHGLADPTKAPLARQTMKGIQTVHPPQTRQAVPLQIGQLSHAVTWLDHAIGTQGAIAQRRHTRDKARLLLLGFWRGFRSDELIRLETPNVELVPGQGMTCFLLPASNLGRPADGRTELQRQAAQGLVPRLA